MGTINYEKFNFEKMAEEVKSQIKKPNILLCGGTGVGKSSLIKDIFAMDEQAAPTIGNAGRPETRGIHRYTTLSATVNLYDSEGYELGDDTQSHFKEEIIGFIDKKRAEYPEQMEEHIHEVWYCISAGNKRVHDVDIGLIKEIENRDVPLMILITKVDLVDEEELRNLLDEVHKKMPSMNCYTYTIEDCFTDEETKKQYVQKDEIIKWAIDNLSDALKMGLIPSLKESIREKRNIILKNCIPKYSLEAAGVVAGLAVVNVPFADSIPLIAIQTKMTMEIMNVYGIETTVMEVAKGLAGTGAVSYLGKTIASNIFGIIPFFGNVAKATVNVSVAVSVTAMLGVAITLVMEQYTKACVVNDGVENLPFAEFFTREKLNDALEYVKNHKDEFNLDDIIEEVKWRMQKK